MRNEQLTEAADLVGLLVVDGDMKPGVHCGMTTRRAENGAVGCFTRSVARYLLRMAYICLESMGLMRHGRAVTGSVPGGKDISNGSMNQASKSASDAGKGRDVRGAPCRARR